MKRPFFILAVGWAAGIGLGRTWGGSWAAWAAAGGMVLLIGGAVYVGRMRGAAVTLLLTGIFFGAAHFSGVEESNRSRLPFSESPVRAEVGGFVASRAKVDGDRLTLEVDVRRLRFHGKEYRVNERVRLRFRLRSPGEQKEAARLWQGMSLSAPVELARPDPARNPGGFDYRAYLHRRSIHWIGEGEWRSAVLGSRTPSISGRMDGVRLWLEERLDRLYPPETAGLMKGMLLGGRDEVPVETVESFTALGLVHLLAISGLHVAVFTGCLYGAATWAGVTREKSALLSILILPFYVLLTGAGAPVIRAAVMAGLGLLAILLGKWRDSLSFLGLAALLMLWWNPYQLLEAGFQLSFLVTLGLLVGTGPLSRRIPTPWRRVNQFTAVTLMAQAASFPLLITHFHEFSLLSWGVNFLVVPVITGLVIPLGYLSLALGTFSEGIGGVPAALVSGLHTGIHALLSPLAAWGSARISRVPPPEWWLAGYGVASFYLLWSWSGGKLRQARHGRTAWMAVLFLVGFSVFQGTSGGGDGLRITFLDVGQGDAAVIETPGGRVILVDGGGHLPREKEDWQRKGREYDVGREVLVPYLKYRGIQQVDWMILTHGDADHIGGLRAVAERFSVSRVLRNPLPPKGPMEAELMALLKSEEVPVSVIEPGWNGEVEPGIRWQFLHPPTDPGDIPGGGNDDSVVFLLTAYGKTVLMTGDVEREGERRILNRWNLPDIDLLKVAHHGSRTSTGEEWLDTVRPREAVISAGRDNRFGHPSPEVMRRLEERGIRVWRTDRHGAVTVRITPASWKWTSMLDGPKGP
ncbi:competence protein ComEC [Melghirimyces profundicolus]|uniref:Competence protein ComEC n=1 Tax=Melghirimyces profundicolus TaxID=1242148 RepID=A0A2T6C917_9BACL|nr:DNA internalization-related competence protein ComEC/Rec2 [Melghirimyces profundicolus]PTX64827.1 competence protein ComEC [Melghirimyces profundicolus]